MREKERSDRQVVACSGSRKEETTAESVHKVIELVGTSGGVAGRLKSAAQSWDNTFAELHFC